MTLTQSAMFRQSDVIRFLLDCSPAEAAANRAIIRSTGCIDAATPAVIVDYDVAERKLYIQRSPDGSASEELWKAVRVAIADDIHTLRQEYERMVAEEAAQDAVFAADAADCY